MDSVLNVGAPAYAQWQHIQGKELDDVPENEQADSKKSVSTLDFIIIGTNFLLSFTIV